MYTSWKIRNRFYSIQFFNQMEGKRSRELDT